MNKSRKIYIGILVSALLILWWDKSANRESATNPQPSQAKSVVTTFDRDITRTTINTVPVFSQDTVAQLQTTATEVQSPKTPDVSIMAKKLLQVLAPDRGEQQNSLSTRNLFVASEELQSALELLEQKAGAAMEFNPAEHFTLSGTIIGTTHRYALINGEVIFPGEYIGPYQVRQICPDAVILHLRDQQITLYLAP